MLNPELVQLATTIIITLAVLAVVYVVLNSFFNKSKGDVRKSSIVASQASQGKANLSSNARNSDQKRKEIQNKLKAQEKAKTSNRVSLRQRLLQSGINASVTTFWIVSIAVGILVGIVTLLYTRDPLIAAGGLFVGLFGLPHFVLRVMKKRRQAKFLDEFPNAIDVVVRGVRSGLPLNDALKMIAEESTEPLRSEFLKLINEQKMGLTIQEGLFRMNDRVQLSELNFLAIVITIQQTMGGNLSETLSGLSKIIRDRKKMRGKIEAMSMEAKSSASIIGSLPFLIMGGILFMDDKYLLPLFETSTGNFLLLGAAFWMLCGILVMRQMINMKI